MHRLSLFGLHGSTALAERVAARLGVPLAAHEERNYEEGEHKTRAIGDVRGHDAFVLHSLFADNNESGNDKLCRLLFFCGALKDAGVARVTAVAPYLCYARKDRRTKPNDPVITRYVAAMFEAVGVDQVVTVDVHNLAAFENAFRCQTWNVEGAPLLAAHFAPLLDGQDVVVVAPDAGGAKRADHVRGELEHRFGRHVGSAYMEKFRSSGTLRGTQLAGDVAGRVAVIVDDMISTGGTLVHAAEACRRAGATRVFAAATHGLFAGGAPALFAAGLDGVVVVNTVPPFRVPADIAARQLTELDVSDSIAAVIATCHAAV